MPDRAAKFVFAIFASVLAGTSLTVISLNAVRAADDCLLTPKAETPEGGHWYYRIERGTKRHCWYLRTDGETVSQTAAPPAAAPAKPAAPVAAAPMQRAVADAHAELPPLTGVKPAVRSDGVAAAAPANPVIGNDNNASAPQANASPSVVASRWPDPSAVSSSLRPPPAPSQMAATVQAQPVPPQADAPQADSQQADASQSDTSQSDSVSAPPPAAAVVPLAAADSSQGLPASLPMLLAVMTGALMLAGLTASIVLKFGRRRRAAAGRTRRDMIWDSIDRDDLGLPIHPAPDVVPRRHFPRDLDQPAEPNDRVADFYAQLSKQARR
jgi:hypothetical protein